MFAPAASGRGAIEPYAGHRVEGQESVVSRIEGAFLKLALELGLAETIAQMLSEIDESIAQLPKDRETRFLGRLREQKLSLRNPTLRTTAALVASICAKDPKRTPLIRRAFGDLVERHPELAWFYAQLPPDIEAGEAFRRAG
jgi:hypothetical protein